MILRKASYSSRDATPTRSQPPGRYPPTPTPKPQPLPELSQFFSVDHHSCLAEVYERVIDVPELNFADVVFLVGGRRFGGLRRVLELRCSGLEQLLLEQGEQGGPVALPDFDEAPRAFRQFLFYLHVGQCCLDNVADVLGLYEVADSFGMTELREACADYLDKAEIADELVAVLSTFAMKHGVAGLMERIVNHIADHADAALGEPARAAQLPPVLLRYLFRSSDIAISEVTLVRILFELCPAQQQQLVPHVRLPRIPALDMMKLVVPSGLFDHGACLAAMAFRENPQSVDLPEEARLPRNQSALASNKLPQKRTSCTSKASREPSGPWGRDFLRFARVEGRGEAALNSPPDCAERDVEEDVLPGESLEAVLRMSITLPDSPSPGQQDSLSARVNAEEKVEKQVSEDWAPPQGQGQEDWGPPESEPTWRSSPGVSD